jgi:hypothetical protein
MNTENLNEEITIPEIDTVPINDEDFIITPTLNLADSWQLTTPETNTNLVLLHLYKNNTLIITLPLTQETLHLILPKLNKIYVDPTAPKLPFTQKATQWAKNHKISAIALGIVLAAIIYSLGYTILMSSLGLGLGSM